MSNILKDVSNINGYDGNVKLMWKKCTNRYCRFV